MLSGGWASGGLPSSEILVLSRSCESCVGVVVGLRGLVGLLFEICIVDASIFAIVPWLWAVVGGGGWS